jgi:hypothetical protein
LFSRGSIASKAVSIEHIIPSSIHGRHTTLTCTECNTAHGSRLDAHLIQRFRHEDILAGKSDTPLRARIQTESGEFGADVFLTADKDPNIKIVGKHKISEPNLHLAAMADFKVGDGGFTLTGSLGYKEIPSRVAALRQAYLLIFSYFGYGYVLFKNADCIRDQISNPSQESDPLLGLFFMRNPPAKNVIGILHEPYELRCFLALLDLSTNIERYLGVVLPGMETDATEIYKKFGSILASKEMSNIKPIIKVIPYQKDFLCDSTFEHFPLRMWRAMFGKEGN